MKLLYTLTGVEVSNAEIQTGTKVYPKNYLVFVENEAVMFLSDGVKEVKDLVAKSGTKPADDALLVAAIEAAKAIDPNDYTSGSWTTYLSEIGAAEVVINTAGKSDEDITTAIGVLSDATEALVEAP